jgi:hypothetical protein
MRKDGGGRDPAAKPAGKGERRPAAKPERRGAPERTETGSLGAALLDAMKGR